MIIRRQNPAYRPSRPPLPDGPGPHKIDQWLILTGPPDTIDHNPTGLPSARNVSDRRPVDAGRSRSGSGRHVPARRIVQRRRPTRWRSTHRGPDRAGHPDTMAVEDLRHLVALEGVGARLRAQAFLLLAVHLNRFGRSDEAHDALRRALAIVSPRSIRLIMALVPRRELESTAVERVSTSPAGQRGKPWRPN